MALAFRAAGAIASGFAQTLEVALPAGTTDGDFLIIAAYCSDNRNITTPEAGWTSETTVMSSVAGDSAVAFMHTIASSESGTYTVNMDGGADKTMYAVMLAYSGADQTTPQDAAFTNNFDVANSSSHNPAAITTVTDDAIVVSICGATQTTASPGTPPSGYTLRAENGSTHYLGVADKAVASAGVEDPGNWTSLGSGADSESITLAIRPAAAASGSSPKGPLGHVLRGPLGGPI